MNYKSHQGLTCILIFMENGNTKSSASPFPGDWWRIKKSIGASKYMGVNLVSEAKSDEYCSLNMRADRRVVQPPSIVPIIRWHPRLHPRLEKPCKSLFKCAASKFTGFKCNWSDVFWRIPRRVKTLIGTVFIPLLWQFPAPQDAVARSMERCTILPKTQSSSS